MKTMALLTYSGKLHHVVSKWPLPILSHHIISSVVMSVDSTLCEEARQCGGQYEMKM